MAWWHAAQAVSVSSYARTNASVRFSWIACASLLNSVSSTASAISFDVDCTRPSFADRADPYCRFEIFAHLSKVEFGQRPIVTSGSEPEVREVIRDVRH